MEVIGTLKTSSLSHFFKSFSLDKMELKFLYLVQLSRVSVSSLGAGEGRWPPQSWFQQSL